MFIEMIDLLRCPRDHEETWLVASFTEMDGRFVIEGKLGCPVCSASYDIIDGVAIFGGEASDAFAPVVNGESVMRTAALLNVTRPASTVVLCGDEAIPSQEVAELTQCRVIALNPSANIEDTDRVATVTCMDRIPLATASVDAIAIGDCAALLPDAARVLRPGSRITASATTDLPSEFSQKARDEQHVVAESPTTLISLRRST
jgi:uncharacterized protein YbaR (Trm112 family)